MPTKAELEARVKALETALEEKDEELERKQSTLDALRAGGEGYLVTTPDNPLFDGMTCGVQFYLGRAFVPKGRKDAERIIADLRGDFGYDVREMTADEVMAERTTLEEEIEAGLGEHTGPISDDMMDLIAPPVMLGD
jgi:hypothetical protein